jgi:hypothetical protein
VTEPLTCQEAHDFLSSQRYWPCGQPATASVYSERDGRAYNMCEAHAYHSVKNRGRAQQGPATPENKDIPRD